MDYSVLFIGGIYPKNKEQEILKKIKRNPQFAANNFQFNLIDGFDKNLKAPCTILNEMFVGSYPKNYADAFIKGYRFSHADGAEDLNLGFCNISYIKNFLRPYGEKKAVLEWATSHRKNGAVFIYSLSYCMVRIVRMLKKYTPEIPIVVAALDLPEHMLKERAGNPFATLWKKKMSKKVYRGIKHADGVMVVAEKMVNQLGIDVERSVLIEAIAITEGRTFAPLREEGTKRIVYAGTLAKVYNVLDLVKCFMNISDQTARLVVCGDGDTRDEIIKMAARDKRIIYRGICSHEQVMDELKKARILVNPRRNGQNFTGFSFPSKVIDYLIAGRPVINYPLESFPPEYDGILDYVNNVEEMQIKIEKYLLMDEDQINRIGSRNYNFIVTQKDSKNQVGKILNLYERIRLKG